MVCGMRIEAHAIEDKNILEFSSDESDGFRFQRWELGTLQKLTNLCLPNLGFSDQ